MARKYFVPAARDASTFNSQTTTFQIELIPTNGGQVKSHRVDAVWTAALASLAPTRTTLASRMMMMMMMMMPSQSMNGFAAAHALYNHQRDGGVGLLRLPPAQLASLAPSCQAGVRTVATEAAIPPPGEPSRVVIFNQTPRNRAWHPGQTAASYIQAKILVAMLGADVSGWSVDVDGPRNGVVSLSPRFCERMPRASRHPMRLCAPPI